MSLLVASVLVLLFGAVAALILARSSQRSSAFAALATLIGSGMGLCHATLALAEGSVESASVRWPIPHGALSVGTDPLSAFFLVPLFTLGGLAGVYGHAYWREAESKRSLAVPWAALNVLIASMALVVVARHAVLFLVAWEIMSVAAYLLVTFEDHDASVRRAGWVYLVAAHLSVTFLIGMFLLLARRAESFEFSTILASGASSAAPATVVFVLALIGFGVKAGVVPLHVWLPEAHAAAPSHVSALMSGVLVKMGAYGMLRVVVLLGGPRPWWGIVLMCLGMCGGALGIALASYQRDLKRVLAYSSVENVGLIVLGIGIGLWGASTGRPLIATLGLFGGLLHVWNHAVMKGLLFLGAGNILHGCRTKDLEELGGLCRRMPHTSAVVILGAAAIAGLPPLNGFVSEWVLYSSLLHGALEVEGAGGVAVLIAIAALSLIGAMTALCFARLVGIALLGQPRSEGAGLAHEASPWMTIPLLVLGLLVVLLAVGPALVAPLLDAVVGQVLGPGALRLATAQVGFGKLGLLNAELAAVVAVSIGILLLRRKATVADTTWGCGYVEPTPRMQYTGRAVSEFFTATVLPRAFGPRVIVEPPQGLFPAASRLETRTADPLMGGVYEPFFARWAARFARLRWMQQGILHVYIVYILVALLVALAWSAAQVAWAS